MNKFFLAVSALVLGMLMLDSALSSASAEQCRIGNKWYDCADPAIKRHHLNYAPGCTGAPAGTSVWYENPKKWDNRNTFHCSGRQTQKADWHNPGYK